MKQVTKEDFFKALYADKRDIMPVIVGDWEQDKGGYKQEWRTSHNRRELFGVSQGGSFWLAASVDDARSRRRSVRVTFDDGDTMETEINGTLAEVLNYYSAGTVFNRGIGPDDRMAKVVSVAAIA